MTLYASAHVQNSKIPEVTPIHGSSMDIPDNMTKTTIKGTDKIPLISKENHKSLETHMYLLCQCPNYCILVTYAIISIFHN